MTNICSELREFPVKTRIAGDIQGMWQEALDIDPYPIRIVEAYRLEKPSKTKPVYDRGKFVQNKKAGGGTKALCIAYIRLDMKSELPNSMESISFLNFRFSKCRRLLRLDLPQNSGENGQYTTDVFLFEAEVQD